MRYALCGYALLLGALVLTSWTTRAAELPVVSHADASLRQFVQTVIDDNPRVQAARAALAASGAMRDAASRPIYNPELSLEAENADSETRAIGLSQTLDWSGKRRARTSVAESERLVVQAHYQSARWSLTMDLLNGLAAHQTGQARDELANQRRQLMSDFRALAERRFAAGDLSQVEVDLARLSSTNARIQQATSGAELAEARQSVRNVVSRVPVVQWPSLSSELPPLPSGVEPQHWVLQLPEVVAAQRQAESANARVALRKRERRPDPTLSVAGGDEDGESLVGVSVTIPLFVRNGFNHEVTAALAEYSQAQELADDVLQRAYARLVSATERYQLSRQAWVSWTSTGEASLTRQTAQLKRLWEAGELSTTDYLVQLTATLDVQQNALELRETLWRAWFEWLSASGQVDAWLGTNR